MGKGLSGVAGAILLSLPAQATKSTMAQQVITHLFEKKLNMQ